LENSKKYSIMLTMDELISLEKLIEEAKNKGVDFGKGDPYNRLRYYTKIGWLTHMTRKKDDKGNTAGHYPISAVDRLVTIENLKEAGHSNEEISKKLQIKTRLQSFTDVLFSKETRTHVITYLSLGILLLIFANELGIVRLGQASVKKDPISTDLYPTNGPKQTIDSGTAFIPKNQKKLFIQTPLIKSGYKVYVTFNQNYQPATRYWISDIKDYRGFTVELDTPVFENSEFNWWVTN